MKTNISDPWNGADTSKAVADEPNDRFADSFLDEQFNQPRLSDSEQYLQKLCKTQKCIHFRYEKVYVYKFANNCQ